MTVESYQRVTPIAARDPYPMSEILIDHKRLTMHESIMSILALRIEFFRFNDSTLIRWRRGHGFHTDAGEVFVGLQEIVARALDDFEQTIHRRNFFELLGQKPLEKVDGDVVVLLSR